MYPITAGQRHILAEELGNDSLLRTTQHSIEGEEDGLHYQLTYTEEGDHVLVHLPHTPGKKLANFTA